MDLTTLVQSWISGNQANNGLLFKRDDTSNAYVYFTAIDAPSWIPNSPFLAPILSVTYSNTEDLPPITPNTPVPEPSTYGLMGAGALCVLGLLRRRKQMKS